MDTSRAECAFCRIADGLDVEAREIFRDDDVVAFFPTEPATLGHTLVIPRAHFADIWAMDPAIGARLGAATVGISQAVGRAMRPEGLNIIQSNGEAATQTVMHVHVHIVPRWAGDAVGRIWPPETAYSEDAKDSAWDLIRDECARN